MRILICEDSVLLREGLIRLLEHAGHEVVAALADTQGIEAAIKTSSPDMCILDVRLPPTFTDEGIRAALEIRKSMPAMPLLVLSQYVEERYANDLIGTASAPGSGAIGYLLKDRVADISEFVDALSRVHTGTTVLDPEVVSQLLGRRRQDDKMQRLSPRERTVLAALAEGRSNHSIAMLLHLSEATVEKHITSIFQKLELEADEQGNRRVLAVLAHIDTTATAVQTASEPQAMPATFHQPGDKK